MKPRINDEELRQMVEDRCLDSQTCKRCRALLDLRDLRAKVREVRNMAEQGLVVTMTQAWVDLINMVEKEAKP